MKRVLVATDLSAGADEAVRQGNLWAGALEAELVVYHVLPSQILPPVQPVLPSLSQPHIPDLPALVHAATDAVRARVAAITGRSADTYGILVEDGSARTAIPEKAKALAADLVVIGSHGSGGILLGSVAAAVIRHAHSAVLVTRESPPSGEVLAATDFSDPDLPAVTTGAGIARRLGGCLTVLHCIDEGTPWIDPLAAGTGGYATWPAEIRVEREREARARVVAAMAKVGATGEARVGVAPAAAEIVRVAREIAAQIVVVGTVGRSGLKRLLLGSTAEAVVRNAPCAVLVERLHRPGF